MKIKRLLYSEFSSIIISFILGLGLATLFRTECEDGKCYLYYAPKELSDINNVYKFNNKCFKINPIAGSCDNSKTIINYA